MYLPMSPRSSFLYLSTSTFPLGENSYIANPQLIWLIPSPSENVMYSVYVPFPVGWTATCPTPP